MSKYVYIVTEEFDELDAFNDPISRTISATWDLADACRTARENNGGEGHVYVSAYNLPKRYARLTLDEIAKADDLGTLFFEDKDGNVDGIDPEWVEDDDLVLWGYIHEAEIRSIRF